ncbi:ARM repeat-containing protein [Martensiomyces pterosporus]|nr:ARM repeat-containing protein [Martensiomyces pterosporus]
MKRGRIETAIPEASEEGSGGSNCNDGTSTSGNKPAGSEHTIQPYETYGEVHRIIVSLKSMHSDEEIVETGRRALHTLKTQTVQITVRQLSVRLAMQLCAHPETDALKVAAGLVAALKEAEPSLRCEIYQALGTLHELKGIFDSASLLGATKSALDSAIMGDLNHTQHHLRCASLSILTTVKPRGVSTASEIFDTACRYSADAHPKVRQAALSAVLRQHMMGVQLPVEMYDECVVSTKDDFEQVRLVAVELVWAISSAYPEYPIVIHKYRVAETIRLLDDAFVKICDMVNDSSVIVRQRACTILGRFKNVDSKFLSQTFSKQVMSHLRRYVPRGMRESSGRNRGIRQRHQKNSSIPTPEGDVDVESDEFRLLDSGAAGAFVHGLEDEYQEVRDAAIESITELSVNSTEFAAKAVDFLVDMFNDSSDRVRLCSIRALLSIGERSLIHLTGEQLSIALSAMKDSNSTVRKGIYAFLAVSALAKPEWLGELMSAIKTNLDKYPEDQMAIYRATKSLGFNHSAIITVPFVRSLLGISEHYLSREARIDDIVYAGNVILIMNTKPHARQLLAPALPEFIFNHLPYLRDKYVDCLPHNIGEFVPSKLKFVKQMLRRPSASLAVAQLSASDDATRLSEAQADIGELLAQIGDRGRTADSTDCGNRAPAGMLDSLTRRIDRFDMLKRRHRMSLAAHDSEITVRYARIVADVLRVQSLAGDLLRSAEMVEVASQIMHNSYAVEARALGLDPGCRLALVYLRLFAHAAWFHVHPLAQYDTRLVAKMRGELFRRVRRNAQIFKSRSADAAELAAFSSQLEHASVGSAEEDPATKTVAFDNALLEFVSAFKPLPFEPAGRCQRTTAKFQASTAARRTIEFNHIFPVDLSFAAALEWLPQRQNVLVLVKHPTQHVDALHPPPSAFKPLSQLNWALEWDKVPVLLPLGSGEETAVELSIALQCEADAPWSDHFIVKGDVVPSTYAIESYHRAAGIRHVHVEIASEGLRVSVNPVQFKPPQTSQTRA